MNKSNINEIIEECIVEIFRKDNRQEYLYSSLKTRAIKKGNFIEAFYYDQVIKKNIKDAPLFSVFQKSKQYYDWANNNKSNVINFNQKWYNDQMSSLLVGKKKNKRELPAKIKYKSNSINTISKKTRTIDALKILGVDPKLLYVSKQIKGTFLNRNKEYYWKLLELARDKYKKIISKYHPDRPDGSEEISKLATAAWFLIKDRFAKLGFQLTE